MSVNVIKTDVFWNRKPLMHTRFTPVRLFQALSLTAKSVAIGLLLTANIQAQSIKSDDIAPFEVVFDVGNNLLSAGTAKLILVQDGSLWSYSLTTAPRGVFKLAGKGYIAESSTIQMFEENGLVSLQPIIYQFRQDEERRRAVDASFDWTEKSITHTYRGNEVTEAFEEPVLDRLSATLLIMNALRNNFTEAELPIFDTGRVKQVLFINRGTEVLKTRIGDMETIKVTNSNASGGSRETTTWFAPQLDYLPVKIEHKKRGELVARLSLISLENRAAAIGLGEAQPLIELD